MKRKTELTTNLEQLQALGSDVRLQLMHYFTEGEHSEAEIAEKLGVPAQSLYYHIRILLKCSLITQVGARQTAKKPVAIYQSVAESLNVSPNLKDKQKREALSKSIAAMLRNASREAHAAVHEGKFRPEGLCFFTRQRLKLSPKSAARFQKDLDALIASYSSEEGAETVCFTAVAAPRRKGGNRRLE